ncbi:MAG: SRPBCC family protein [Methanobacteriota archaeon]
MKVSSQVEIRAPKQAVWDRITDIENAASTLPAIQKIEILERPKTGLVGLKWRETRTMFGKTATEVMWITEAKPPSHYETRAESHASIYRSRFSLAETGGGVTVLTMEFGAEPQTFGSKLMWALTGFLFKGATRKAIRKDLEDVKAAVER